MAWWQWVLWGIVVWFCAAAVVLSTLAAMGYLWNRNRARPPARTPRDEDHDEWAA